MEPAMTNRYFVARFIEDLARRETKNIGVFLATEDGVSARFLGERPNRLLDLRTVRSLVQHTPTYKQWIEYWRFVMSQTKPVEEIASELVSSTRGNFVVEEGQALFLPREIEDSRSEQLDYLFRLVVSDFSPEGDAISIQRSLSQKCNEIIRKYQLNKDPHFRESPMITIEVDGAQRHIRPSYQWLNGRDIYFQKVLIDESRFDPTQKDVTSAAWMFERLKEHNKRSETKALVKFSDREDSNLVNPAWDQSEFWKLLNDVSDSVINIDDEMQVEREFSELRS
jgi:hypothetical protein